MYRAVFSDGIYRIHKDELELKTPAGRDLICESRELAERLTLHLNQFGQAHDDPVSIAAFHYPWLDFGQIISRDKLELSLAILLNPKDDWALHNPFRAKETRERWEAVFGDTSRQIRLGRKWLSRLSVAQLLAVSVVQRTYASVNVAFLAHAIPDEALAAFVAGVRDHLPVENRPTPEKIQAVMENFCFYYRLDENGGGEMRLEPATG